MNIWIVLKNSMIQNYQLPKYEECYSKVSGKNKSQKEYENAQHIWNHFNINTMGEHHDLYLQLEV